MATLFASFSALTEVAQLILDVAVLLVGLQTVRTALDALDRLVRAWLWLAGLLQLLLTLLCTVIGEFAPLAGRYLGRAAGTTVRLGRQARALYNAHLAPIETAAAYSLRAHVAAQLGTAYPQLQQTIAPATLLSLCIAPVEPETKPETVAAPLTRRQLLTLAKERKLPGYSRLTTDALREALTAA